MADSKIQSYRDLRVWQEAVNLAESCYRLTKTFPKEELYGMTTQIRRASVSIAANIAEGTQNQGRIHPIFVHSSRFSQRVGDSLVNLSKS